MKKENLLDIFMYILIFCTFMGSNFIKFNIFGVNFNIGRVMMLIATLLTFIGITKNIIKKEKLISLKDKNIKYCIIFFIIWSIYSISTIYRSLDIKMYVTVNFFVCIGTINILFFSKYINIEEKKNNIFNMIVIPVFINCIYYLYLYFIKNENIGGLYHNSNDLGTVLLIAIPMAIYLIFNTKNVIGKILNVVILAVLGFSFMNITSRGAILGVLFAIIMIAIISLIKNRKEILNSRLKKIIVISIICISIILAVFFINKYMGKINFIPVENAQRSNDIRINLIYNGLYFLKQDFNLITGIGAGNNIYYLENYSIYSTKNIYNFHNFWMDLLVEYGLIVFIGFISTYVIISKELLKKSNEEKNKTNLVFLLFWFSFLIACISSSTIMTREWIWITFAIIIAYINEKEKIKEEN